MESKATAKVRVVTRAKPASVRVKVDFISVLLDYDFDGVTIVFRDAIESP
jgi:hypothetical protein